jgi:2-polyprenyl-3-methyl-5-hydroxy-6-metoxy-1,4-benzoquinol methylase
MSDREGSEQTAGNSAGSDGLSAHDAHMEEVQRSFDERAGKWSELYHRVERVNDLVLIDRKELAVGFVRDHVPEGGRVLDAGCGAGWASLDLARSGYSVHGIDLAENMIERARANFAEHQVPEDRYRFTHGDVMHGELESGSYDGALLLGVVQYQVEEEPLLERIRSVLRPGGVMVVTGPVERQIPNAFGLPADLGRWLREIGLLRTPQPQGRTRHYYSVGRFRRLLTRTGFEMIDHVGHGFGDWEAIGPVIGFRGELLLHRFFSWLARFTPVDRWANDLVVAGRKHG